MDMNLFRGVMTLIIMALFIGICVRVYSRKRKPLYDQAAHMALEKEGKADE
ncbi:cbb3-type cytochrome oxidase subunit 3 [Marinicella sp. W31]|uniref:cbb3-type cytochrome oxidase subunit 3 n=1 Tax=Marinicella sp. W31 TaxID=3023713 RepID=UPI003756AC95